MPKSSFKVPNRPGITSAAALALLAAALTVAVPSARGGAPDWLRAAAKEKLPDYPKETVAIILLDEQIVTVRDKGEIDTLHRRAFRILRPEAREGDFGGISVDFDSETTINYIKAWTILPDGSEIDMKDKDTTEEALFSDTEFDDDRSKVLEFAEPNPGSVIGYEYVQRNRPFTFEDDWWFQDVVPIRTARLSLQVPSGWEYSAQWFNYSEQKPLDSGAGQYVWELHDIPALKIEPEMPPSRAVAGWVGLKYFPRDPAMRAKSSGSWKDVGLYYDDLTQSRRVITPDIKQKVAELTSGIPDRLGKMQALAKYVQQNIHYYGVETGIGAIQPHPAGQIFAHGYGDCKDKATLLSTMLGEIGVQSYYVWVDSRRGVIRPDYPSVSIGNHVILAIRLPDDVSDALLFSIVKDPQLGRLLIFDPTNEYVPLGYLPSYLQDGSGLLEAPGGGELISLPLLPPQLNRLVRTAKFTLDPSGNLSGEVQEVRWGGPAEDDREELLEATPAKRTEFFEKFLGASLGNFYLTGASIGDLDEFDQNLLFDYKFTAAGYAKVAGGLLIVRPRVLGDKYTGYLDLFTQDKPRTYPIEFQEATRQDDIFDFKLPPGYVVDELPPPVQAKCDYASYRSETQMVGDALQYKRTLEIKDVTIPPQKLQDIRAFFQQIAGDQNASAIFRRANP